MLILVLAGVLVTLLRRRFYYGNDDLLEFVVARDHGLSWTTLSYNVFQHFAPYNRLAHLIVFRFTDLDPAAGMAFMAVNYVAMLSGALWLMTELRLSVGRRVLALTLIGLSVSVSEAAIWFDAAMHILPAIAVTLAVCAAHVRGIRTGKRRWHGLSFALFVLGQLVQERPIFALPLAVLVDLLLLWRALPWRDRLARLWAVRRPLLALTVAALLIATALRIFVVQAGSTTPSWGATAHTVLSAFSDYWLPSLVNLPRAAPASVVVEVLVLLAAVGSGVVVALLRRSNGGPVIFVAGTFLMYYGFLKFSPILTTQNIDETARRLDYAGYVTVPAVIALVHLRPPVRLPSPGHRWGRALAACGLVVLAAVGVVTDNAYLGWRWAATTQARAYLDAVRADSDQWSASDVTLIPLRAPRAMATGWAVPFARQDQLLSLVVKGFQLQDLGEHPVLIDDTGTVRPAVLQDVMAAPAIVTGACDTPAADDSLLLMFDKPVRGGPLFLVVRYRAQRNLTARILTSFHGRTELTAFGFHLRRGEHTAVLPIDATRLESLAMASVTPGASFCAESARAARPLVHRHGDHWCRPVDEHGRPEGRVRCP